MTYKMLDGNGAAVEAMKLARVQVISAYPITPQSSIAEKLSEIVANGELKAEYIRVESEHTAMSLAMTAQLTGVRAATATASNGLALMHEVLSMTSGNRAPVVMPVVNRGVAAPWTLWCEHGDSMAQRDMGWIQYYCQNVQEVFDFTLAAYRVAENSEVLTPAMVCLDGFFLSHSEQKIDVPDEDKAYKFVGPYESKNAYLDTKDPMFLCDLTGPEEFTEMRYQQKLGLEKAIEISEKIFKEFKDIFGRELTIVKGYLTEDADVVLVSLGSMCGTVKHVVDNLRKQGQKVGMIKMSMFRPFPVSYIRELLKNKKTIGVFDRSAGLGGQGGPVWTEVSSALNGYDNDIRSYIGGLGGRDVSEKTIEKIFKELFDIKKDSKKEHSQWVDLKENPMDIRQVYKKC